jgi:hypothetical protein
MKRKKLRNFITDKRKDLYQSIGFFKTWFRQSDKRQLTSYYEITTHNTVTQAVETKR